MYECMYSNYILTYLSMLFCLFCLFVCSSSRLVPPSIHPPCLSSFHTPCASIFFSFFCVRFHPYTSSSIYYYSINVLFSSTYHTYIHTYIHTSYLCMYVCLNIIICMCVQYTLLVSTYRGVGLQERKRAFGCMYVLVYIIMPYIY